MTDYMKAAYNKAMESAGYDTELGCKYEDYLDAIQLAESNGKPIKNPSQLQNAAGGKYAKARVAYTSITSAQPEKVLVRNAPDWFVKPLKEAIQLDIERLWVEVDKDIYAIVNSQTQSAHSELAKCSEQLLESDLVIDRLQVELEELNDLSLSYKQLNCEYDELKIQHDKRLEQLAEQQKKLDLNAGLERQVTTLEVKRDSLKECNNALEKQLNGLNQTIETLLVRNGYLEGRIEKITTKPSPHSSS
ncbi:hypothetical protein [Vibrio agarivorans]|uniref:hypothetical protein n=1 Tax=Vibrio agarivorans TaxID=153622 RepID=UPI0025B54EB2|nr:hypothetical protein [Vibrio agarivorans]MDN3663138.1 hypothetical protein [Vibrio agarivorans]